MTQIVMPLQEAQQLAVALLPHTAKDDVTRILMHMNMLETYAVATDRYTAATMHYSDNTYYEPGDNTLVPREAIEYITKIQPRKLNNWNNHGGQYNIDIVITLDSVAVHIVFMDSTNKEHIEESKYFDTMQGNYPPVERVIDSWEPATDSDTKIISLSLEHLNRQQAYMKKFARQQPLVMQLGHSKHGRPAPVKTVHEVNMMKYTVLTQPNLLKK